MGGKGSGGWNKNKYSQSEPGANSKAVMNALIGLKKPRVDVKDPQAIVERMEEYLNYCIENDIAPSVAGCANWLGVHIDTVSAWYSGRRGSPEHQRAAANFYGVLQDIWAQKMDNGNLNPVSGIFMGKAFYGYKDTQEIVVSNNNNQERSIADLIAESKRLPGAETITGEKTIDADYKVLEDDKRYERSAERAERVAERKAASIADKPRQKTAKKEYLKEYYKEHKAEQLARNEKSKAKAKARKAESKEGQKESAESAESPVCSSPE